MGSRMTVWAPFPYKDGTTSRDKSFSHEKRIHLPSIFPIETSLLPKHKLVAVIIFG